MRPATSGDGEPAPMSEPAGRNARHAVTEELRRHGVTETFGQDSPE